MTMDRGWYSTTPASSFTSSFRASGRITTSSRSGRGRPARPPWPAAGTARRRRGRKNAPSLRKSRRGRADGAFARRSAPPPPPPPGRAGVGRGARGARGPAFARRGGGGRLLSAPRVLAAVGARVALARLLEPLAGQGVAGAAVLGRVSPEARRAAEAHALPLFALPATLPLDQIEQQVLRFIVDERAQLHERAQDLHRQLSELALAGRRPPAPLAPL